MLPAVVLGYSDHVKKTEKPQPTLLGRNRQFGKLYKTDGERKTGSICGDQAKAVLQVLGFGSVGRLWSS